MAEVSQTKKISWLRKYLDE